MNNLISLESVNLFQLRIIRCFDYVRVILLVRCSNKAAHSYLRWHGVDKHHKSFFGIKVVIGAIWVGLFKSAFIILSLRDGAACGYTPMHVCVHKCVHAGLYLQSWCIKAMKTVWEQIGFTTPQSMSVFLADQHEYAD